MTDIGFLVGFSFGNWINKIYCYGFSDMDWIDIYYQSTSDTKLVGQSLVVNGGFALIQLYGYYHSKRK